MPPPTQGRWWVGWCVWCAVMVVSHASTDTGSVVGWAVSMPGGGVLITDNRLLITVLDQ